MLAKVGDLGLKSDCSNVSFRALLFEPTEEKITYQKVQIIQKNIV